jgi:predicted nucleic acid-binding protein
VKILESHIQRPDRKLSGATEEFLSLSGAWQDPHSADTIAKEIRRNRKNSRRFTATALGNNLSLVTNNERHFSRVPGLKIANWAKR